MLAPADLVVLRLWLEGHGWQEIDHRSDQSVGAFRKRLLRDPEHLRRRLGDLRSTPLGRPYRPRFVVSIGS